MTAKQSVDLVHGWLEIAELAYELAGQAADRLQALLADEETRVALLGSGPCLPAARREEIRNKAKSAARLPGMLEFLTSPSRRTLRNALEGGLLPPEVVAEELRAHERATEDRYSEVADLSDGDYALIAMGGMHWPHIVAAVNYEETDQAASEIAQREALSRSQVYAAVDWYRGLPISVRDALAVAVFSEDVNVADRLGGVEESMSVVRTRVHVAAT